MPTVYDIAWYAAIGALAPLCGLFPKLRRKVGKALRERMGNDIPAASATAGPCVMLHAVSLGEMNATRSLVVQLTAARPELRFLITVTTDTGFDRGRQLYGDDARVTLVRYPLDLSSAIRRLLDRQCPIAVVLMELEVWPNFVLHCTRRNIPVLLVNGRLTESSFRGYRRGGVVTRAMFGRLSDVCAQDEAYADRFRRLGAKADRVSVTGTMKFDTADIANQVAGDLELAASVGLRPGAEPIWVCGSTGPREEAAVLKAYQDLLPAYPHLRLAIIPRHPERFDEVASLIWASGFGVVRRSKSKDAPATGSADRQEPPVVILGDTMGELRKFYSLADVVLVGRSLVDLGQRQRGSDMIEPAALAKPVVVGPWTHNFADAVRQLKQAKGLMEIESAKELASAIRMMLADRPATTLLGERAREVVRAQQGATARHVAVILNRLRS